MPVPSRRSPVPSPAVRLVAPLAVICAPPAWPGGGGSWPQWSDVRLNRVPLVDVSAIGEALLRLSVRPGERLEDAPAFDVHVAGSEANVAYALARLGRRAAWTSALPADPLGRRVAATLAAG